VNARKAQQGKIKQLMKEQEITIQHRTNYFILFHMPLSITLRCIHGGLKIYKLCKPEDRK
jgi:hypothetical protein